jgi:hypothetical protein
MKSFTFTTLACLMLSAANVEAIDSAVTAELEHHHVSISTYFFEFRRPNGVHLQKAIIQRNGA